MTSNLNLEVGTLALNISTITKQEMLDIFYPVGSVYISMNITSPSELFGGEWTRISDCFMWCTNDDNGPAGETGGSKKIATSNLPSHSHAINIETSGNHSSLYRWKENCGNWVTVERIRSESYIENNGECELIDNILVDHTHTISGNTKNTGSGADYMPPFMRVYAWYRTA